MRNRKSDFNEDMKFLALLVIWVGCLVLIMYGVTGCSSLVSTPEAKINKNAVFMYDLHGTVNGQPFDGIGVIKKADKYVMRIESRQNVDMFTVTSCRREFHVESAIKQGWFKSNKGYEYIYNPSASAETKGSCLVRLGAYTKDKEGIQAWGLIDFEGLDAILPAVNKCNGFESRTSGVTICQSRAGLIQMITFDSPVMIAEDALESRCRISIPEDGINWEYKIPRGECVIAFMEKSSPNRIHRLTTVGYTDIMIRGE